MKTKGILITLTLATLLITGCETTSSRPYSPSTQNVIKLKSVLADNGISVKVAPFTQNENVKKPVCRLSGAVDVAVGSTMSAFIQDALTTELFTAGAYDDSSASVIMGNLTNVNFSSISPAKWMLSLDVSSNNSAGYTVSTEHEFKTSFSAYSACQNVADAFTPAVQGLIRQLMEHPQFGELVGR